MTQTQTALREARSRAADLAIEEIDLGDLIYLGRTGWEDDGFDRLACKVFLEPSEDAAECSSDMAVGINFAAGTDVVLSTEYELPESNRELDFAL